LVLWCVLLTMFLQSGQADITGSKLSSVQLAEGHYQLTVLIEDSSLGRGVAGLDVTMQLKRGFLLLGRKKTDLDLSTDTNGRVVIQGLPKGKVELLIYAKKDVPERFDADLQPGPKNRVQLKSGRLRITIEWVLR
jgi:hypothetical protein